MSPWLLKDWLGLRLMQDKGPNFHSEKLIFDRKYMVTSKSLEAPGNYHGVLCTLHSWACQTQKGWSCYMFGNIWTVWLAYFKCGEGSMNDKKSRRVCRVGLELPFLPLHSVTCPIIKNIVYKLTSVDCCKFYPRSISNLHFPSSPSFHIKYKVWIFGSP